MKLIKAILFIIIILRSSMGFAMTMVFSCCEQEMVELSEDQNQSDKDGCCGDYCICSCGIQPPVFLTSDQSTSSVPVLHTHVNTTYQNLYDHAYTDLIFQPPRA